VSSFIFIALFFGGTIALQIYLCKPPRRRAGLILPCISFALVLLAVFATASFAVVGTSHSDTMEMSVVPAEYISGSEIRILPRPRPVYIETIVPSEPARIGGVIALIAYIFVLGNIPTVILLAIYFSARRKLPQNPRSADFHEIDRMTAQDL
jgi:hypothetical protein